MHPITNLDKIITKYPGWQANDLAYIKSFSYANANLEIIFLCQLREFSRSWPDVNEKFFEVAITFEMATDINFKFRGNGIIQLDGFDIIDRSVDGWQRPNLQVYDYESDAYNFLCSEIIVNTVSNEFYVDFEDGNFNPMSTTSNL